MDVVCAAIDMLTVCSVFAARHTEKARKRESNSDMSSIASDGGNYEVE